MTKENCKVAGCYRGLIARGFCNAHYLRFKRKGHVEPDQPVRTQYGEALAWLTKHADYGGQECLPWPYAKLSSGYGTVDSAGRTRLAHRVMCELAHGNPPSPKHHAAHNCGKGKGSCVNPRHLRWATALENAADKNFHGTQIKGEKNHNHKLTQHDVRSIRNRYKSDGSTLASLASEFGVNKSAIQKVIRRESWAWLP